MTVFETLDHVGGHTKTVTVPEANREITIDTGFIVFNRVTYPNLCHLFDDLGVETQPTEMSFSVQHLPGSLEFGGAGLNALFAQRLNFFGPRHWRMLLQVNRFNREAILALDDSQWSEVTLGEYIDRRGYGPDFRDRYLIPMASAVWSATSSQIQGFPATTMLRFFHNHGFLGLHTQHPWFTVKNGATSYVRKLIEPFADRVCRNVPVRAIDRTGAGVTVYLKDGTRSRSATNIHSSTWKPFTLRESYLR